MNNAKSISILQFAVTLALPLALAACGGEDSSTIVSSTDPAIAAALQSAGAGSAQLRRAGRVELPAGAANVLVGLDHHGTGVLDASAATTTRTRADGSYSISYQPSDAADAERFKTAALLAEVQGAQGSYTLSSPGTQSNAINPLTTLVYRKMLACATLEAAEMEVAQQLDIGVDAIYQLDRSSVAMSAASLAHHALANGFTPLVAPTQDHMPQLVALHFKDIHNYEYDVHTPEGGANAAGRTLWRPVYGGRINGNDRTPGDAAYTATIIDGFTSTGREEYLQRGVLKLFAADNQFTPVLLGRKATAEATELSLKKASTGYALDTTLRNVDLSGLSMQTFFGHPASYQVAMANVVHRNAFTVEDTGLLADAVFPPGSVLHIQLGTPVMDKNSITYKHIASDQGLRERRSAISYAKTLEHHTNDLSPAQPQQSQVPSRALEVRYALNESAWKAVRQALQLH